MVKAGIEGFMIYYFLLLPLPVEAGKSEFAASGGGRDLESRPPWEGGQAHASLTPTQCTHNLALSSSKRLSRTHSLDFHGKTDIDQLPGGV